MKFKRGDKVQWWSHLSGPTKAIFVEPDPDFPARYCILAIGIGVKGNRMTHTFRWPLRQVDCVGATHTMTTKRTKRRRS